MLDDSKDPIKKSRINQLAEALMPDCYADCGVLVKNPVTVRVAAQLFEAAGGIGALHAEGYSRASGKDRARYYEYSLGSVRESMSWYKSSAPALGNRVVEARLKLLEELRRLLLAVIPRERYRTLERRQPSSD